MPPFDGNCLEFNDCRRVIVVKEKGKEIHYKNSNEKEIALYRVDGCLLTQGECCDYLLLVIDDKKAHFIELKGSHLEKAIKQIDTSISELANKIKDYNISARIVIGRVRTPSIQSSIEMKLKRKLKQFKGELVIKVMKANEPI